MIKSTSFYKENWQFLCSSAFVVCLLLIGSIGLQAQNWSGNGATNDWSDPLNWDNLTVPGPTDNVSINPNNSNNYPILTAANNSITIAGLNVQPNAEFTIGGTGVLTVTGAVNISGTVDNQGTWGAVGLIVNFGGITNSGTANLTSINNAGTVDNSNGMNFSDTFTNLGNATMTNLSGGTLNVTNLFSGFGDFDNQAGATFIAGEASISGDTNNDGTVNIGADWTNSGNLTNSNIINVTGTFTHTLGNTFINENGGIINTDELANFGTLTNNTGGSVTADLLNTSGTFQNLGDLTVVLTVDLGNAGTLINQGTLNITGTFQNFGSGSLQNQGGNILASNLFNFGGMLDNDTDSQIEANVLVNTGDAQNNICGEINVDRLENGGGLSFQNDGKLIVGNVGFSNPGTTFVNDGIVFDNTANDIFNGIGGTGIVLENGAQIFANANITMADIGASNGAIDLTVVGGIAPYTFSWSNGATSEDLTGLQAGDYTVVVTDSDNCIVNQVTNTFTVEENPSTCLQDGVIALYEFNEGSGNKVYDVSGFGSPLNLTIANTGNVSWGNGTLSVNHATIIKSATSATKIINALKASNEITIEAWVKPANTHQSGPARIATLSQDVVNRNFTLGQDGNDYIARLRTNTVNNNGMPNITTHDALMTSLQHVIFTRSSNGNTATYVDGVLVDSDHRNGNFSNWASDYKFALANELSNDRSWLGEYDRIVIYDRAITPAEVTDNFFATADCDQEAPEGCIETNLIALYDFEEGSGNTVNDVSGFGSPLNLTIANTSNTNWIGGGGLSVNNSTIIQSATAATKIINACKASQEITIETWVRPDNLHQSGPARIATVSQDTGNRNFTLGQDGDDYVARLRTTTVNNNGMPNIPAYNDAITAIQHVVFTRDSNGNTTIYVDGELKDTDHRGGNFNNWNNSYKFALANELSNNRPWKGDLYRVGIYDRVLKGAEIQQNFFAGFGCSDESEPNQCVDAGIVALYNFQEGSGNTIHDVSGFSSPMNLTIDNPSKATWVTGGGLDIHSATIVKSSAAASKITTACKATNEITIEAWVRPDNLNQNGPARIATLSSNTGNRNFTLGQEHNEYVGRLRTTTVNNNGMPNLVAYDDVQTSLQHVVFTRDANSNTRIYVNGVLQHGGTRTGNFSNWSDHFKFALGNELTNDRPWLGTMYRVAVYNRALNASEVNQNYFAGFDCDTTEPPVSCNSPEQVLFVVGNATLNNGDIAVKGRLEALGHTVTVKDDDAVQTADSNGKGLIVISSTTSSGKVTHKFRDVTIPVIVWEAWLFDDMKMTGNHQGTDYGSVGSQSQIQIDNPTHPITNGLVGNVTVMNSGQTFYWGKPTNASKLASVIGQSNKAAVFAYDTGDQMVGMNAPARRVGLFFNNSSMLQATGQAQSIFDAAVNWTTNTCGNIDPCALPSGFSSQDISTGIAGSNCYDASTGTHTIEASGSDIWNNHDEFRYVYTPFSGSGEMVARVTGLVHTDNWAKAGIMLRETLNNNSKHASIFMTPSNGVAFQFREHTGGSSAHMAGGSANTPIWLKLERIGNTIKAYKSTNGTTWNYIGSKTISMSSTVYIGLAVTSHNNSTLTTATIDNVSINGTSKTDATRELAVDLMVDVYPNPFVDELNVSFSGATSNVEVIFSLYSMDGRLLQQAISESNTAGTASHQFFAGELQAGNYILTAQSSTESQSVHLVKVE